jgi:hypothetical protein
MLLLVIYTVVFFTMHYISPVKVLLILPNDWYCSCRRLIYSSYFFPSKPTWGSTSLYQSSDVVSRVADTDGNQTPFSVCRTVSKVFGSNFVLQLLSFHQCLGWSQSDQLVFVASISTCSPMAGFVCLATFVSWPLPLGLNLSSFLQS